MSWIEISPEMVGITGHRYTINKYLCQNKDTVMENLPLLEVGHIYYVNGVPYHELAADSGILNPSNPIQQMYWTRYVWIPGGISKVIVIIRCSASINDYNLYLRVDLINRATGVTYSETIRYLAPFSAPIFKVINITGLVHDAGGQIYSVLIYGCSNLSGDHSIKFTEILIIPQL